MQSGDYLSDQLKMKWDTQDVDEDFELHLSPSSKEVVEIQKSSKETNSFTICFWKKGGGIYVRSYLWLNISQEIFVNLQSPKSFGFVHNSTAWNFYCFLMADKDETLAVSFYLNGERKSLLLIEPEESNNENLIVGYLNSSVNDKAVLSSFNIWSGELSSSEVKRLSYGCDSERGDVIHWKDFNHLDHDHEVVETKTCKNVRKERLVLKGTGNFITVKVDQHAPSNAIGFCLKFRYMIYGPGARFFQTSIIKEHEDVSSVVWKDDDNTQFRWKYADIPFLSPGYFQVKFEGSAKSNESYIAISQVFVENRFCSSGYSLLTPVCERNIMTAPGIIEQLYYPHSSMYGMNCWWVIDAPDHHVIRFTFLEFLIPYTKGCNYVSLEICDGDRESGDSLGRFCGYIYPQFVQSSSNRMTLHFHAPRNSAPIRGFKGHYEFLEAQKEAKKVMVKHVAKTLVACFSFHQDYLFQKKNLNQTKYFRSY
ncbi:uncharacterized protein LOC110247071 [Exaiptasia diaphana]|uniref:Uncharacterized protein n=1 Tax=Exaiptasia diaphana TaxID=2652724 RepID=A0A913YQ80_EXADI|nr:uncharacterized protein LOC110247071 [Exaiptasia diaphana]